MSKILVSEFGMKRILKQKYFLNTKYSVLAAAVAQSVRACASHSRAIDLSRDSSTANRSATGVNVTAPLR